MNTQIVTLESAHNIPIPSEAVDAFGLHAGSRVAVSVKDGGILIQPLLADDLDQLCGIFSSNRGLEEELYKMRHEEEEHSKREFGC